MTDAHGSNHAPSHEISLPELLDLGAPTFAITTPDASWEVHVRPHTGPELVYAFLIEIRPDNVPQLLSVLTAPVDWDWGDFLAEAYRQISLANRFDR